MQDANDELAVLRRVNGNLQGQFERMVEHDPQTGWRVLRTLQEDARSLQGKAGFARAFLTASD